MPDQDDSAHQRTLLSNYRSTARLLLEQRSMRGVTDVPPHLMHDLRHAHEGIARAKATLREWGEQVVDAPEDGPLHTHDAADGELYYDAGAQIRRVREELELTTSELAELLGMQRERTLKHIESGERECPISVLQRLSALSGSSLTWLKHGKGKRYTPAFFLFEQFRQNLDFFTRFAPQQVTVTLADESFGLDFVIIENEYQYHTVSTNANLRFWRWVPEEYAMIPVIRQVLQCLTATDDFLVYGQVLPEQQRTALVHGEIHPKTCIIPIPVRQGSWVTDMIRSDVEDIDDYADRYGAWFTKIQRFFRQYV